jgi:hypothetical protein
MKVAMPDSTERVSTSHQVATTARKTSKKSATKKGGPRLTKNCRVYVKQNIVLKIVPPNLHSHVKSFGNNKTRKFYGTCLPKAKSDGTGYRLKLDDFEAPNNIFNSAAEVLILSLKVKKRIFRAEMKLKRKWWRFSQRRIMPIEQTDRLHVETTRRNPNRSFWICHAKIKQRPRHMK